MTSEPAQRASQLLPHRDWHAEAHPMLAFAAQFALQSEAQPVTQSLAAPVLQFASAWAPKSAWHAAFTSIIAHENGHWRFARSSHCCWSCARSALLA
jgi:hypothetical protein